MPTNPEPLSFSIEEPYEAQESTPPTPKRPSPLPLILAFCLFLGSIMAYRAITLLSFKTSVSPTPAPRQMVYASPEPSPVSSPLEQATTFTLDAFSLNLKANLYYGVIRDTPLSVSTSRFDDSAPSPECKRVENVSTLLTLKYRSDVSLGYSPSIFWTAWSTADVRTQNDNAKKQLEATLSALDKAMKHADGSLPVREGADFELMSLNACGGGWFFPVYKKTFSDERFSQIAYFEVNSGNGLPYVNPTRVLVVKNVDERGEQWLQIHDSGSFNLDNDLQPGLDACDDASLQSGDADLKKSVSCVAKVWNERRDMSDVSAWVESRLAEIENLR